MKQAHRLFRVTAILLLAGTSLCYAQAPSPALGDMGSVVTGKWDTLSTWKMYSSNGAFDSTVTSAPSSGKNVFILTGTTVTYETSSQNCKKLIIQSGATLQSNVALPTTTMLKVNGSTVWVDGNFGSGPTDGLSIETKYSAGALTIGGSGTINIAQFRPNSSQAEPLQVVFAANANINYAGSSGTGGSGMYLTNRGLQKNVTVTVNAGVALTFGAYSNFGLTSSSSTNGNANVTINVNGTINLPSSNLYLTDSAAYTCTLNIGATGTVNAGGKLNPYLATGGGAAVIDVAAGGKLNILSGGTADFTNPTATVTGTGTFTLNPGATINIGALAGLDAAAGPIRTATAVFDTSCNFGYMGTGIQAWGALLPDSVANLRIGSSSIDSITTPFTVLGDLQIDGLLVDNDSLKVVGSTIVNGTYQHNTVKCIVPTATWNDGSTFVLSRIDPTLTTGLPNGNQNFYNYTVDCPTLIGVARLGMVSDTIRGNFVVKNTNNAALAGNYITPAPKATNSTVTILGDLRVDSTAANFGVGYGSSVATQSLIVKGNILNKGILYCNGSGMTNKVYAYGDVVVESTLPDAFRGHSAALYADTLFFCGSMPQRFVKPLALTSMSNLSLRVMSGSTLSLNDTTVVPFGGIGKFTADSGATVKFGHPNGVNGNITLIAPVLSSGASYEFNSDSAQVTGTWLPKNVRNLTINDSLGVSLSAGDTLGAFTVTGTLGLAKGRFVTSDTVTLVVAAGGTVSRTAGYVDGRLQKTFAATGSLDFETGTENGYSPVNVKVTAGAGDMTVKAVQGQHPNTFDAAKTLNRYWNLASSGGITGAELRFYYLASDVNGTESKYGAWRYTGTGTTWTPLTSINQVSEHSVVATGVTSFSDWTLGESDLATSVDEEDGAVPNVFYVDQNYPNPFNPATKISYGLPAAAFVTAKVYNMLGQEVVTLFAGEQSAGVHTLSFDGAQFSTGVYLYRIQAGNAVEIKRMVLLK